MEAMNVGAEPLAGKIDMNNIVLIGHSRGGEAVVKAFRMNAITTGSLDERGPPVGPGIGEGVFPIRAVISIAPTTLRQLSSPVLFPPPLITAPLIGNAPYLLIYGSADRHVTGEFINSHPFRLYDLARGPKQTLWIYGANHNFFNQNWGVDDATQFRETVFEPTPHDIISELLTGPVVPSPRLSRDQQQQLTNAYVLAFLKDYVREDAADTGSEPSLAYREFFSRPANLLAPPALSGIRIHSMYGVSEGARVEVDNFEEEVNNEEVTSTGQPGVEAFDLLDRVELDLDGGADDSDPNRHTFFGASKGVLFGWNDPDARYVTVTADKDISELETLSFRVTLKAFDALPGDLEMAVALRDADGRESEIRVSAFTNIPQPYERRDTGFMLEGPAHNRFTKSVFKTIRIPVSSFLVDGRELDLTQIEKIIFQFRIGSEILSSQGRLALDDIEFTKREP